MSQITLSFVSFAALVAALPYLEKTPGLVTGSTLPGAATTGNVVTPPAATAPTAPTVAAAPVAAPETTALNFGAPQSSQPSPAYTLDQVKTALMNYNAKYGAAFAAAMQKFGFTSFDDIAAAPGSWVQLMQYIGADTSAVEQPTFEKVAAVLQTWAKINGAAFQQAMAASGLTSLEAVKAAPGKWAELLAAAKAAGVS